MKKMMMVLFLLVGSFTFSAQANDGEYPSRALKPADVKGSIKEAFRKKFPAATFESWSQILTADLYLVRFVNNNEGMLAYVDETAEVVATVRAVSLEMLPITVIQVLQQKYHSFSALDAMEMVLHGELYYLVNLENEKSRISVKVGANGDCYEVNREKRTPTRD